MTSTPPAHAFQDLYDDTAVKVAYPGCQRLVEPAETVARVNAVRTALGITRVANVTGLDRIGVPVVMVCRPNARSVAVSQGKGLCLDAAKASGLMEAAEAYHAEHIQLPLKYATHAQMSRTHRMADVSGLPRIAGNRFHEHLNMLWLKGYDLLTGTSRWLPFECVRADFTLPLPPGSGCFDASTNGLASGNNILEAVCHGICEVVERDATALWRRLPASIRRQTRVDPGSVDDPGCREVMAKLAHARFGVAIWDITRDIAIPTFYCIITDRMSADGHLGIGAGTHPSRGIALLRALTEAVQVRTTYISGARDDLEPAEYRGPGLSAKLRWAASLLAEGKPRRDFHAAPDFAASGFAADLKEILDRLRAAGISEVIAADLSREMFDLPVVKICIPGLEGADDHDAYVPGVRARRILAA